jgi:hypothetical protein
MEILEKEEKSKSGIKKKMKVIKLQLRDHLKPKDL